MKKFPNSDVLTRIEQHSVNGAALRERFFTKEAERIAATALRIAATMASGGKLLLCGNGGSAADCQHIAAEYSNRFLMDRPPLPAIAITTDTSALTAIGNDFSFKEIFSKQVQALAQPGDILLGISTSGNSENVLEAFMAAQKKNVYCLGFAGRDGGKMASLCDTCFVVDDNSTALVQEVHITLGHLLCEFTDYYLFENTTELTPFLQGEKQLPI